MKKQIRINTLAALINQLIIIVCGLILPRLIMKNYGSEVNGLINSLTEILGFITLLEMGIGAVTTASLYGPIANNDIEKVSRIYAYSKRFYKTISFIFIGFVAIICIVYPLYINSTFDFVFTILLTMSISLGTFGEYCFGIVNHLFLKADQKVYISLFIHSILVLLNTVVSYVLIKLGFSIIIVKLVASLLYLTRPIFLYFYVKKHYKFNKISKLGNELPDKWHALGQHLSSFVLGNTDITVLTIFSDLFAVSVYSAYLLIGRALKQVISSLTSGIELAIGKLIAKEYFKEANSLFSVYEFVMHNLTSLLFSIGIVMIVPFIMLYTSGINDTNYSQPIFGILLMVSQAMYCIRLIYNSVVLNAGHFKQTEISSIIEMILNIVISIILVNFLGLIGVAIGTVVALTYKTICLVIYCSKKILIRKKRIFFRYFILDISHFILAIFIYYFFDMSCQNYLIWFFKAIIVSMILIAYMFLINLLFNRKLFVEILVKIKERVFKK